LIQRQGKLGFCAYCKELTETVIVDNPPFLGIIKTSRRVCIKCGEPKPRSRIEQ
jgi:hypothetical protein